MTPTLPNALARSHEIWARLAGTLPACFLDYDGTLTPIVERPELAVLSTEMRETLARLAGRCPVAIVSGRDRHDVAELVQLPELIYAGSHGFDIAGPNGLHMEHEEGLRFAGTLDAATEMLRERLRDVEGVLVERKRFAAAVHFRLVARDEVPIVKDVVGAIAVRDPRLRQTGGKQVLELRPNVEWDKGRAVRWLLNALRLNREDVTPIYVGDDATDEDAFRSLPPRGIGVMVGESRANTRAQYGLRDPGETRAFLERLYAALARPHGHGIR